MAAGDRNGATGPEDSPDGLSRVLKAARDLMALSLVLAGSAASGARGEPIYHESGGLVVVEIESIPPAKGWSEGTELSGYTGRCYYMDGGGGDPLVYKLLITTPGRYRLALRNRHDFHDATLENDCWTQMDDGPKVKTFSSQRGQWTWHTRHEFHGGDKPEAAYDLDAGLHTFTISGRSKNFSIDRFHLFLDEKGREALDPGLAESGTGAPPVPDLKVLKTAASHLQQGRLGPALADAERRVEARDAGEAEEARRVVEVLGTYADKRREDLRRLKASDPATAASLLGDLARQFGGTKRGSELAAEARAWQSEPATRNAVQAQQVLAQIEQMAQPLLRRKDAGGGDLAARFAQELAAIGKAVSALRKRYPDTPASRKALELAARLGASVAE